MKENEIIKLFDKIKMHYNTFVYDTDKVKEWHRFLKEYDCKDVLDSFDKYVLEYHDRPPLVFELTRGLDRIEREPEKYVYIQCDLCKEKILVGDDSTPFDKHYRKCQKIDFIDRQAKEIRGYGITKSIYYNKSDEELDKDYRKVMDNWVEEHPDLAITPEKFGKVSNIFKKMEDVEDE